MVIKAEAPPVDWSGWTPLTPATDSSPSSNVGVAFPAEPPPGDSLPDDPGIWAVPATFAESD